MIPFFSFVAVTEGDYTGHCAFPDGQALCGQYMPRDFVEGVYVFKNPNMNATVCPACLEIIDGWGS